MEEFEQKVELELSLVMTSITLSTLDHTMYEQVLQRQCVNTNSCMKMMMIILQNIVIKKGSQGYSQFKEPTSPMFMSYYVFDVQNTADALAGKKPKVLQRGPYTYKEIRKNIPIVWEDGGNLLTYKENKTFVFDPAKSCSNCSESDIVTTPNIVPLVCIPAYSWLLSLHVVAFLLSRLHLLLFLPLFQTTMN